MNMKTLILSLLVVFIAGRLAPQNISAQTPRNKCSLANFKGTIEDAEENGISKVKVTIESKYRKWMLESTDNGEFSVCLPPETYKFILEKESFKVLIYTDYVIKAGKPNNYKFRMEAGVCSDCDWIIGDLEWYLRMAPPNNTLQPTRSHEVFYSQSSARAAERRR